MQDNFLKGRAAFIFPDNDFDVDQICGVENILVLDIDVLVKCAMRRYDTNFAKAVRPGDFLVGGENFGYGHPHFQGMSAMRALGISAVIAESFSPDYWRGEISVGFLQIPCPGILQSVKRWDAIEIDLISRVVRNVTQQRELPIDKIPELDMKLVRAGGLVPFLRQEMGQ